MGDRRWGFEDLDDSEFAEISGRGPARQQRAVPVAEETVSGQDADRVVTVHVTRSADIASVNVATGWKQVVEPRVLGASVSAAANAATAAAMIARMHEIDEQPPPASATRDPDRTPLTRLDVNRLLEAVAADLERFTRQAAEVAERRASAESAGRHVSGTAQRGHVLEVSVDPAWAARSRTSEIELELVDVLRQLRHRSTPGDLAQGPQSSAIAELNALGADPATLLERLRLGRNQQPIEGSNGR